MARKPKPLNPKFKLKMGTPEDPFFVHPETIPDGVALQWVADTIEAQNSGWKVVDGQKPIGGLVLMWAPKEIANAQRDANIKRAREMAEEMNKAIGRNDGRLYASDHYALLSPSFVSSFDYPRVASDAPPIDVEVKVKMRIDSRFQDAASALGLSIETYAQRRIDLYIRGDIAGIILPIRCVALELFEGGHFELTPDRKWNS